MVAFRCRPSDRRSQAANSVCNMMSHRRPPIQSTECRSSDLLKGFVALMYAKRSLLLLGSFAFGYNAAMILHELGHACGAWLSGGTVARIALHPFSWSYTHYGAAPRSPVFATWAGMLIGTGAGLVILIVVRFFRSAWLHPLLLTGICSLMVNGIYFGVDGVLLAGGDATRLVAMGASRAAVSGVGLIMLALGFLSAVMFLPHLGFAKNERLGVRMLILQSGVSTYLIAMLAYHLIFNRAEITLWLVYVIIGVAATTVLAVVFPLAERLSTSAGDKGSSASSSTWPPVISALFLGMAIVVGELAVLTA